MPNAKLTAKQEAFCQDIADGMTQAGAYRYEYPSDAIEVFRFGDFAGWLIEVK